MAVIGLQTPALAGYTVCFKCKVLPKLLIPLHNSVTEAPIALCEPLGRLLLGQQTHG
jgi:hypothetical protein